MKFTYHTNLEESPSFPFTSSSSRPDLISSEAPLFLPQRKRDIYVQGDGFLKPLMLRLFEFLSDHGASSSTSTAPLPQVFCRITGFPFGKRRCREYKSIVSGILNSTLIQKEEEWRRPAAVYPLVAPQLRYISYSPPKTRLGHQVGPVWLCLTATNDHSCLFVFPSNHQPAKSNPFKSGQYQDHHRIALPLDSVEDSEAKETPRLMMLQVCSVSCLIG